MATGTLEVKGTIEVDQFWPDGTSDADTTKVLVKVSAGAFRFRPHPGAAFKTTHVYDGAKVKGRSTNPVVDAKGRITVRLQGIDAPELHYMPQPLIKKKERTKQQDDLFLAWNFNYRQRLGETSTKALGTLLKSLGADPLPCTITTAIDHPNDAFDMFGRLIGDVVVRRQGQPFNVNHWLLERGWAFPTFYNSMSAAEIATLQHFADGAAAAKRGVWKIYKKAIGSLNFSLRTPKAHDPLDPDDEKPPVIMPKLFRRQVTFAVNRRAKMFAGSFETYLTDHFDRCYLTDDFVVQGPTAASPRRLNQFVDNGTFKVAPGDLVFREDPSTLLVPGGGTPHW